MVADIKITANTINVSNYIKKLQRTVPRDIKKALNKVSAYAADQVQKRHKKDKNQMVEHSQDIQNNTNNQINSKRKQISLLT